MAGYITVDGVRYEFPDSMKLGEARLIKQVAGIGTNELSAALDRGDPDLVAALVLIVMRRAGRRVELSDVDDLDITEIDFGEGDPDPPAPAAGEAATNGRPETTPPTSGTPPTVSTST